MQKPPLIKKKAKAQMCLKYMDCNYLEFRNRARTVDSSHSLQICHQNIRGTKKQNWRINEFFRDITLILMYYV